MELKKLISFYGACGDVHTQLNNGTSNLATSRGKTTYLQFIRGAFAREFANFKFNSTFYSQVKKM